MERHFRVGYKRLAAISLALFLTEHLSFSPFSLSFSVSVSISLYTSGSSHMFALIKPGGEAPVTKQGGRPPTNSQSGTEALDGHNLLTW